MYTRLCLCVIYCCCLRLYIVLYLIFYYNRISLFIFSSFVTVIFVSFFLTELSASRYLWKTFGSNRHVLIWWCLALTAFCVSPSILLSKCVAGHRRDALSKEKKTDKKKRNWKQNWGMKRRNYAARRNLSSPLCMCVLAFVHIKRWNGRYK